MENRLKKYYQFHWTEECQQSLNKGVKLGRMKKGHDHLSRFEHGEEPTSLEDTLSDAQMLAIRKIDYHFT
jgi:hypothetical protein